MKIQITYTRSKVETEGIITEYPDRVERLNAEEVLALTESEGHPIIVEKSTKEGFDLDVEVMNI